MRRGHSGGIPIEEAPWWVLAIAATLLALVLFPGLVGLLDVTGLWRGPGDVQRTAVVAGVVAAGIIGGVASLKPWRRRRETELHDDTPLFARFSTWLIGVVFYPHLIHGLLVLTQGGEPVDYAASLAFGLLVSAIQGALAWSERRKARRRRPGL